MQIDLQITAHLGQQVAANLFLSILEGGEFSAEIQTAVASFSLVGHELTDDLPLTGEISKTTLELGTLHDTMLRHLCPNVNKARQRLGSCGMNSSTPQ